MGDDGQEATGVEGEWSIGTIRIRGCMLFWNNGAISELEWLSRSSFSVPINGKTECAELKGNQLVWDDGDVWDRREGPYNLWQDDDVDRLWAKYPEFQPVLRRFLSRFHKVDFSKLLVLHDQPEHSIYIDLDEFLVAPPPEWQLPENCVY